MKYMRFAVIDTTKVAEYTKANDKVWASPPKGIKAQAMYACLGITFPDQPPNTIVGIAVVEAESAEALGAASYPLGLTGANVWYVPVLDVPIGGSAQVEKKLKG